MKLSELHWINPSGTFRLLKKEKKNYKMTSPLQARSQETAVMTMTGDDEDNS